MPFSFKRSITVQGSQVPESLANFPMLFSGTYTYLCTLANGGQVQSASGFDIVFYLDEALTVKLDHEIDFWSGSTGVIQAWIRIPSLAGGTNTTIWLAYGDNTITTSQENKTAVWDSNYLFVTHFGDGTTLSGADSTSNGNNLTEGGSPSPTATTGVISGGVNLVRSNSNTMLRSYEVSLSQFTMSCWVRGNATPSSVFAKPVGNGVFCNLNWDHGQASFRNAWDLRTSGGNYVAIKAAPSVLANTWYNFHITWNGSTARSYNAGLQNTSSAISSMFSPVGGQVGCCPLAHFFNGRVDEFRYSNIARSANWILTEYRNQNSPSTFYAVGDEIISVSSKIKKVADKTLPEIKAAGGVTKANIKKIGGINKN
jgi:hypothetical protein